MTRRRDGAATALAALVLAAAAAGCSHPAADRTAAAGSPAPPMTPAVSPLPVTSTAAPSRPSDIVLPIAQYLFSDAQSAQLVAAHTELVARCMKRYGFAYGDTTAAGTPAAQLPANESRYGVMTDEQARYGYHFMAVEMKRLQAAAPAHDRPELTPAMTAVLTGRPGGPVDGRSVPSGGCNGEATARLGGKNGRYGNPDIAESIQSASFTRSLRDPRVQQVFAAWSACMRTAGYHYPDPNAAIDDPRWGRSAAPTSAEISTAQTDVGCKQRTGLVGVWSSVESAYQRAAIKLNADALRQAHTTMQQELRTAAALLGLAR